MTDERRDRSDKPAHQRREQRRENPILIDLAAMWQRDHPPEEASSTSTQEVPNDPPNPSPRSRTPPRR